MQLATLDKLIWKLILGGMVVSSLGWFMQQGGGGLLGWSVLSAGALAVVLGVVLVFVRARKAE